MVAGLLYGSRNEIGHQPVVDFAFLAHVLDKYTQ